MKVSFINYYYDKDTSIDEYINKYPTICWNIIKAEVILSLGVNFFTP